MTIQEAREYANAKREIMELDARILRLNKQLGQIKSDGIVADTVQGSRRDGSLGTIKVEGVQATTYYEKKKELSRRTARAKHLKEMLEINTEAFEEHVYSISNGRVRRILSLRYIDELTWQQVADKMGLDYSADNCRMTSKRYFQEKI